MITLPPSITVLRLSTFSLVSKMVAGPPQLNVIVPPPFSAAVKAASVQLPGVPSPTTPAAYAGRAGATAMTSRPRQTSRR